jgi:hypothetical protein
LSEGEFKKYYQLLPFGPENPVNEPNGKSRLMKSTESGSVFHAT